MPRFMLSARNVAIFVILAILVVGLALWAIPQYSPVRQLCQNANLYRNDTYGFQLCLPEGWTHTSDHAGQATFSPPYPVSAILLNVRENPIRASIESVYEGETASNPNLRKIHSLGGRRDVTVAGRQAVLYEGTIAFGITKFLAVPHDNYFVEFSELGDMPKTDEVFVTVAQSLTFK